RHITGLGLGGTMIWQWTLVVVLVLVAALYLIRRLVQTSRARCCQTCGSKRFRKVIKKISDEHRTIRARADE
ncbi:MAG: hypothetical protein NTW14_03895, partial [bacterium]|nr:hypothetical protein [bacterium]